MDNSSSLTREAAISSLVLKGLHPDHAILAPAAASVLVKTAVSLVTCKQPPTTRSFRGFDSLYLFFRDNSTCIFASAHSIFFLFFYFKKILLIIFSICKKIYRPYITLTQ